MSCQYHSGCRYRKDTATLGNRFFSEPKASTATTSDWRPTRRFGRNAGAWIAAEAKLSPSPQLVDRAVRSLLRLREKVARRRIGDRAALVVATSAGAAYRRNDGVQVAPITSLGP